MGMCLQHMTSHDSDEQVIAVLTPEQHKELLTAWVKQFNEENGTDLDPEKVWSEVLLRLAEEES